MKLWMMSQRTKASGRGFTLLELLVAISISVVIAGVLLSVAVSTLSVWNRSNGRWATAATAAVVLDQVESDLQSMTFAPANGVQLAADILTVTSTSGTWVNPAKFPKPTGSANVLVEGSSIADGRFGTAGVWLRFFIGEAGSGNSSRSMVRAVSYQIVRRSQTSASGSELAYMLFRSVVTEENTMKDGYDLSAGEYMIGSGTFGAAGNVIRPTLTHVIADHVVDFGIRFYRVQGTDQIPYWPATGGSWSNTVTTLRLRPAAEEVPTMAEVAIWVLTDEGIEQLRLHENQPVGFEPIDDWWGLVDRYAHVYVRRVRLKAGGR